jgi:hypothetical protein
MARKIKIKGQFEVLASDFDGSNPDIFSEEADKTTLKSKPAVIQKLIKVHRRLADACRSMYC